MFLTLSLFPRSIFKRSLSDGIILHEHSSPILARNGKQEKFNSVLPDESQHKKVLSESSPEISTCESDITFSRFVTIMLLLHIVAEQL